MHHHRARAARRAVGVALLVAVGASGCRAADVAVSPDPDPDPTVTSSSRAVHPVDRTVSLTTADGRRSAIVHHPAGAGPGAPLLVVLHPAATSAATMQQGFGWDGIADRDGVVVAYPDGLLDLYQDTWNGGGCCPPASQLGTDDVGFLDELVTALRRNDAVGAEVYAVGYSNGGVLAYAWACRRPGLLQGIGVVAGALMTDCTDPGPLDVVAVHGTADDRIPLQGGPGPDAMPFPSVDASLAPFRRAAGCGAPAAPQTAGAATVTVWSCAQGRRVVLDLIDGGGHSWPGAGGGAGSSTDPADATGFVWAQVRSH